MDRHGGQAHQKLGDDAFTRVRVILMIGIETDALRCKQALARVNRADARGSRK